LHQVLYLSPERYLFLLNSGGEWILREFSGGSERARLVMKNILAPESSRFTDDKPLLFNPGNGGFAILAGTELLFWSSMGARPVKSFIKNSGPDDLQSAYPVQSLRVLPDGGLLLLRRHVFGLPQFYSIAVKRLEGYTIEGSPGELNPGDYRCSAYIATRPCICDILPCGDDLLIHTPGSIRDWSRFEAEASLLIRLNRKGQVVSCTSLEKGWGTFSVDGKFLIINPFGDEKTFQYYDLEAMNSSYYITDENVRWTPATGDTRFLYAGHQIVAWNGTTAVLSDHYNAPSGIDGKEGVGVQAG
jgi:hypothetical protein